MPIFHAGKLIGWVGGVTHVIDTGAVTPGSMSTGQTQRFGDGYMITCRKTGVNDTPLRDWLHESQRSVRTPKYWILDEKTRIAGCHMVRQLVEDTIAEEGLETYQKFAYEVIEEGRRGLATRVKAMTLPGIYRKVAFVDVPYAHPDVQTSNAFAKLDSIMHAPVEMEIRCDGSWRLDFEGASRWGWHSYNAHQVAFTSGIWVMMTQTLVPTQRINDGAYYGTEFHMPKGGWNNPDDRRTGHAYAWHFLVSAWTTMWRGLSQAYFSRGYLEEVNAGNANTSNWLQGGGINQDGEVHAVNSFEASSCGTGAGAIKDGLNHAAAIWNPEGDMGDIEIWEMAEPLLYLGRNVKANSGGYGQYRGGNGFETLRMVWKAQDWTMFFMGNGYMNSDWGLMGGYPSATGYRFEAHHTGLLERIARGESLPLGGDAKHVLHLRRGLLGQDALALALHPFLGGHRTGLALLADVEPLQRRGLLVGLPLTVGVAGDHHAVDATGVLGQQEAVVQVVHDGLDLAVQRVAEARPATQVVQVQVAVGVAVLGGHALVVALDRGLWAQVVLVVGHVRVATSFGLSKKFTQQFRDFWDLPASWTLTEDELSVPSYGANCRMDLSAMPDVRVVTLVQE